MVSLDNFYEWVSNNEEKHSTQFEEWNTRNKRLREEF